MTHPYAALEIGAVAAAEHKGYNWKEELADNDLRYNLLLVHQGYLERMMPTWLAQLPVQNCPHRRRLPQRKQLPTDVAAIVPRGNLVSGERIELLGAAGRLMQLE